ncbi:GIY-YIG nuclease family protein [Pseudomonas aeruginosa]|uniref:GIY-YIG nuclease family protein n=1 Tax=Pseudomonas aeruginosa TaxID=287 RepID=UPI0023315A51|nr:GIY-YIG nuclease family protein [Pseudomonas aeruginosa]MDC0850100.1 GIY-YIG nuclease family protein [Pseudomonas aeruginosa]
MSGYGFVYVLTSPAMPGLYKVGATTRSPRQRAEELSRGTGVPHECGFHGHLATHSMSI